MIQNNRILAVTAAIAFFIGASVLVSAQDVGSRPVKASTSLGSVQASLRDIAQKIRPAVVEINVTEIIKQQGPSSIRRSTGSTSSRATGREAREHSASPASARASS